MIYRVNIPPGVQRHWEQAYQMTQMPGVDFKYNQFFYDDLLFHRIVLSTREWIPDIGRRHAVTLPAKTQRHLRYRWKPEMEWYVLRYVGPEPLTPEQIARKAARRQRKREACAVTKEWLNRAK